MKQDEIIDKDEVLKMAMQVGGTVMAVYSPDLIAFAKLVEDKVRQEIIEKNAPVIKKVNEHIKELQDAVKAEREACAKLVDDNAKACTNNSMAQMVLYSNATAIRARGEA